LEVGVELNKGLDAYTFWTGLVNKKGRLLKKKSSFSSDLPLMKFDFYLFIPFPCVQFEIFLLKFCEVMRTLELVFVK